MLNRVVNEVIKRYQYRRFQTRMIPMMENAEYFQQIVLQQILKKHYNTKYSIDKGLQSSITSFPAELPVTSYEDIFPYIQLMLDGEHNILTDERVKWFAKSSGTTNDRSKYIPITDKYINLNLINSSWDATTIIYNQRPDARLFSSKSLIMGGSVAPYPNNKSVQIGDISAIMISTIPAIGRPFYTPDLNIAQLDNWDMKIERILKECVDQDVVMFGGVPTWNIVLFNRILEYTGKNNMLDVWPNLKTYIHGGVSFDPYRALFKKYIPSEDFDYIEVYNASEGYFAVQDTKEYENGMLLLTNNGIYYEFITIEDYELGKHQILDLSQVQININYVLVITTISGLCRYIPGDTIQFISTKPPRIKVTGRTKQFINVFGEEVMVSNTDRALTLTCQEMHCQVAEYTIGPVYLNNSTKGGHEWFIEFDKEPDQLDKFIALLDHNLRKINSDYDAKRSLDLAMVMLKLRVIPSGTFYHWMKFRGKVGGQNKVPRLSNDRRFLDDINSFMK